ncbi:hypothetical protein LXN95_24100, partial [Escherichia coli]|nr:hypothetical protein [Escherichia coli]
MNNDFSAKKILTGEDVLCAAVHRIEWLFETFSSVCLSFSGGKDSTVLLHLTADVNRPGFPGECFICELRLPDHRFRWKH